MGKRPRASAGRELGGACCLAWLEAEGTLTLGELHFASAEYAVRGTPPGELYGLCFQLVRRGDGLWSHIGGCPWRLVPLLATAEAELAAPAGGAGTAWALANEAAVTSRLQAAGARVAAGYTPPQPAVEAATAGLRAWLAAGTKRCGWDLSRVPAPKEEVLAGGCEDNPLLATYTHCLAHAPLKPTASRPAVEARLAWRTGLCAYISWAVPNAAALAALCALGPLLELGAGTGYWATLLHSRGVDIAAFDAADSHEGLGWRFRAPIVQDGGPEVLARPEHAARALFLCWPDIVGDDAAGDADRGSFGADCLARFCGSVVAHVGELGPAVVTAQKGWGNPFHPGGSSSSAALQRALAAGWEMEQQIALPCWPPYNDALTIWRRKPSPSGKAGGGKGRR